MVSGAAAMLAAALSERCGSLAHAAVFTSRLFHSRTKRRMTRTAAATGSARTAPRMPISVAPIEIAMMIVDADIFILLLYMLYMRGIRNWFSNWKNRR